MQANVVGSLQWVPTVWPRREKKTDIARPEAQTTTDILSAGPLKLSECKQAKEHFAGCQQFLKSRLLLIEDPQYDDSC